MSQTTHRATNILELHSRNFQDEVLNDPNPILIDFWAPWCMPCQIMKAHFNEAGTLLKDRVRVGKVNVDEEPRLSQAFGIKGIPAFVLVKQGRVLGAWSGVMSARDLEKRVRALL